MGETMINGTMVPHPVASRPGQTSWPGHSAEYKHTIGAVIPATEAAAVGHEENEAIEQRQTTWRRLAIQTRRGSRETETTLPKD